MEEDTLTSEVSRPRVSLINYTLSPDISRPPEYASSCTVNSLNRTTSVSCSNTTLNVSEYLLKRQPA